MAGGEVQGEGRLVLISLRTAMAMGQSQSACRRQASAAVGRSAVSPRVPRAAGGIQPHMQGRDEGLLWPQAPAIPWLTRRQKDSLFLGSHGTRQRAVMSIMMSVFAAAAAVFAGSVGAP